MSNHIHVVVRNRPDVVASWSDDEVARRWWNLFPKRRDRDGNPAEPTDSELSMTTADPLRTPGRSPFLRLSHVSWFMRAAWSNRLPGRPTAEDQDAREDSSRGAISLPADSR